MLKRSPVRQALVNIALWKVWRGGRDRIIRTFQVVKNDTMFIPLTDHACFELLDNRGLYLPAITCVMSERARWVALV